MFKNWKILLSSSLALSTLASLNLTSCSNNCKYPNIRIACMGDSITYGLLPNMRRMKTPYPEALQKELSVDFCYNYGVSGSTICAGENSCSPMASRIKSISQKANIIIFWGGVNDYRNNCKLGSKTDTESTTIYGALNNICTYLTNSFANKFIMFITPLPTTATSVSYQLTDVCDAIQYTCSKYQIPVLDLYKESGFEQEMTKPYSDGIHPSQEFILNSVVPKISTFIRQQLK